MSEEGLAVEASEEVLGELVSAVDEIDSELGLMIALIFLGHKQGKTTEPVMIMGMCRAARALITGRLDIGTRAHHPHEHME